MISYSRTITDEEQKILEHDLIDIVAWINNLIGAKLDASANHAAEVYRSYANKNNLAQIPVKDVDCAKELFKLPNYKNRVQRIEDDKASAKLK